MTSFVVQKITLNDVASAMELSTAARWNQTAEDWKRLLRLSPENCRGVVDGRNVIATATLLPYGKRLAWVGMVLTHPEYRRRGLARLLMEETIAAADRDDIQTLMLDATDEGRPLYEECGFVAEQSVERWERKGHGDVAGRESSFDNSFDEVPTADLLLRDASVFGAERDALLRDLCASGKPTATANAYVLSRAGREARYLGPCVSTSADDALRMIVYHLNAQAMASNQDGQGTLWYWDLLSSNVEARRCAETLGFIRRRVLWRMRRGDEVKKNDAMVYAIAGFELG